MSYKTAKVYTDSEWVDLAVAVTGPNQRTVKNVSGTSYTLLPGDAGYELVFTNSSSISFTVPSDTTSFVIGQSFVLIQYGTGVITVAGDTGVTVNAKSNHVKSAGQYSELRLIKVNSNEWLLSGDLSA